MGGRGASSGLSGGYGHATSIGEAEKQAAQLGVKYADYKDFDVETANMINKALSEMPEDMRPEFVGSFNSMYEKGMLTKNKQSNNSFGVNRDMSEYMKLKNGEYEYVRGFVGYNPRMMKREERLKTEWNKNGKVAFNTTKEATVYHELGHVVADRRGIPDSFTKIADRWYSEQPYQSIKRRPESDFGGRNNGYREAYAEGYAGYKTKNKKLPKYVSDYFRDIERGK